jgi:hypothetical protein
MKREKVAEAGKGIHNDDVMFLLMPDRFADDALSKGNTPSGHGYYNRASPMACHDCNLRGFEQHLD